MFNFSLVASISDSNRTDGVNITDTERTREYKMVVLLFLVNLINKDNYSIHPVNKF